MAQYSNKQGNYVRAFNAAATLLAWDQETINGTPKEIAKAVGELTTKLYELQNDDYEEYGFDEDTDTPLSRKPRQSRSSNGNSKRRSSNSRTRSRDDDSGGGGLKTSDKQKKFFASLIDDIEDGGEEPVWSLADLSNAGTYDERQEMVDELIEQRNDL